MDFQTLGGSGSYHGLELEATRQFRRGLYMRGWWEWRSNLTDVDPGLFSSTIGFESEDPTNRKRDKGWQNGVSAKRFRVATVWDVPIGRGMRYGSDLPGILQHIFGNWTTAFLMSGSSGARFTPTYSGSDPSNTGRSSGRPDQLCNGNGFGDAPGQVWNRACFAVPPNGVGRYGTASRGSLSGPLSWFTNMNLFKTWYLTGDESGPYFKAEAWMENFLNHANSSNPSATDISSASFGLFTPNSWEARRIHIRLRLGF